MDGERYGQTIVGKEINSHTNGQKEIPLNDEQRA